MKLYLLRHASTSDSENSINGSRTDTPLSETGLKQAQDLVSKLSENKYDLIIVSPLQRTRQTIEPYLSSVGQGNIKIDGLTTERDLGVFTNSRKGDGKIKADVQKQGGDRISWKPENGESILDVYERAKLFVQKLRTEYSENSSILICSHKNFLRNLELLILNRPPQDFYSDAPPLLEIGEIRGYEIEK